LRARSIRGCSRSTSGSEPTQGGFRSAERMEMPGRSARSPGPRTR
jgi:hypothetical protein